MSFLPSSARFSIDKRCRFVQGPWIVAQLPTASCNTVLQPSWSKGPRTPSGSGECVAELPLPCTLALDLRIHGGPPNVDFTLQLTLWLIGPYSCEFRFVCRWWLLSSSFQCGYVPSTYFFTFPSRTLPRSRRTMTDSGQLRSSISLLGNHAESLLSRSTSALNTLEASLALWFLVEEKETWTNRQNSKTSWHSIVDQSVRIDLRLCSGAPRPVGDLAGAATFLSNRKYRYRPYTQKDVGNCWPWRQRNWRKISTFTYWLGQRAISKNCEQGQVLEQLKLFSRWRRHSKQNGAASSIWKTAVTTFATCRSIPGERMMTMKGVA